MSTASAGSGPYAGEIRETQVLPLGTAARPQAFSQLSSTLERALAHQVLSMDAMTDESDPSLAIGVARLHLEAARGLAVDLHKHLNAARNATAHIISQGVDDGQESMPWDQP